MKTRLTLLTLAVLGLVLSVGLAPAQAVLVHTDTANSNIPPDLPLPNTPLTQIGPGGLGDTTPFGPGTWDIDGVMNQFQNNDDGDGLNWEVAAGNTFDLHWNWPGGGFTRWSTGFDNWGAGNVSLDVNSGSVLGLAAGQYSGGAFETSAQAWTWQIVVTPIPEPSSFILATLGFVGLGLVTLRRRRRQA